MQFELSHFFRHFYNGSEWTVGTLCAQLNSFEIYRCLNLALKMCMWFGYDPQINFITFFLQFELSHFGHFDNESERAVGTLCAQLLLQFYSDSFETLQMA